jgi:hypothetical protein
MATPESQTTSESVNVFLCYRRTDGKKVAQWLFESLNRQRLLDTS